MLDWGTGLLLAGVIALTAIVTSYVVLRLSRAAAPPAEDPREMQRRAIEINDDVVQGLTVASLALQLGHTDRARAAVDRALASSRTIISELIGEHGEANRLGPGDLVRREAALRDVPTPTRARDEAVRDRSA